MPWFFALTAISDSPQPKRVLIPGAGLGRLAYEVLRLGDHYHVVAVERSVLMTIALHNLLKHPVAPPSIFYPYLQDPLTNSPNHHRRFTASSFPDLTPVLLLPPERRRSTKEEEEEGGGRWYFSIENTDFTSLSQLPSIKGTFDVVATCYFIDTTVNVLDYLWAIRSALTDGGYWINLGPLKYHHTANEAVHLSLEELLIVAEELGFEVLQHQQLGATLYRPEVEVETIMKIEPFQPVFIVARLSSSPRPHTINQNSDGITRE